MAALGQLAREEDAVDDPSIREPDRPLLEARRLAGRHASPDFGRYPVKLAADRNPTLSCWRRRRC
jgi:hypothetical protein